MGPGHGTRGKPSGLVTSPLAVVVPTAVAAVLAMWGLGDESVWLDEAVSVAMARMDVAEFLGLVAGREVNGALYYAALRAWAVVDTAETWVRLASAVFATAAVPIVFALGARLLGGRSPAFVAALLVAVNPFVVTYAQEARSYSLAVLLSAAATLLLLRALERPTVARLTAYVLVAGASLYAHVFAAFVVVAHVVALFAVPPSRRSRLRMAAAVVAVGVLALPIALIALRPGEGFIAWLEAPTARDVARTGMLLAGGHPVLAVAYAVLLVAAGGMAARASRRDGRLHRSTVLLFAWLLVAPVAAIGISLVKPVFYPRFLIVIVPAMALLAAYAVARLPVRGAAAVGVAALVAMSAGEVWHGTTEQSKEAWREATAYVLEAARPGDGAVFVSASVAKPFAYYVDRLEGAGRAPRAIHPVVSWGAPNAVPGDQPPLRAALEELRRGAPAPRVWLVVSHEEGRERPIALVLDALRERYEEHPAAHFRGIEVRRFELTATAGVQPGESR